MDDSLGVEMGAGAEGDVAAGGAGRGANGAIQERCSQPMEKSAVQAGTVELPHRAAVTVRQDRLRSIFGSGDVREPPGNRIDGLVPGNARELPFAFRPDSSHRPLQSIDMIDPVEIAGDLLTKKALGE